MPSSYQTSYILLCLFDDESTTCWEVPDSRLALGVGDYTTSKKNPYILIKAFERLSTSCVTECNILCCLQPSNKTTQAGIICFQIITAENSKEPLMLFWVYWQLQTCEKKRKKNMTALLVEFSVLILTSMFHKIEPLGSKPSTDAWDCRELLACALLRAPQIQHNIERPEREAEGKNERIEERKKGRKVNKHTVGKSSVFSEVEAI